MTCLAATCELIRFPNAASPDATSFRDIGGRGRGSAVSVRVAVAVMAPAADANAERAEAEQLMLEDPERWDGLS
jgi:hypothetical protein